MTRSIVVVGIGLVAVLAGAWADDSVPATKAAQAKAARDKAELKKRAEKYLDAGTPGVHFDGEKDVTDGRHVRLFVVGTATISTVLGAAEGLEIAREKAEESAKAEFVKWLGSTVTVRRTSTNELLLMKEGDGSVGGPREQGKKVERTTTEYQECAAGLVRGLKVVAYEQKGKARKMVVVYRWDAVPGGGTKDGPAAKPPGSDPIPDKRVVIDDTL